VYDRLFIRHWDSWKRGTRSRLFALPLAGDRPRSPVLLSDGLDADVPASPFGDRSDYVISSDSERVVFSARVAGDGEAWSTNFDLYGVDLDGRGEPVNLTPDSPGADTHPVLTRDGRTLIYLSMARGGFEADRRRVLKRELRSGRVTELAPAWDRSPGSLALGPDDDFVYAIAQDMGQRGLFQIPVDGGGAYRLPTQPGTVSAIAIGRDEPPASPQRLVYAFDSLTQPTDLFELTTSKDPETGVDVAEAIRLTDVNADALARIEMGAFEQFSFDGWNDERVYGYVMKPAGAAPGERYPVAFLIHGGPQGSFGNHFHYRWNPQTYAGAGYAAIFIDFHGSTGYGQAFTDSISGDWGGKPLVDLQKGLAAALERYPWLDGDRVCALGASYGGYMVNWIAGNWPERFRCLVNHDGIFDNRMMYYTTEELWFPEWEFGGPQFRVPMSYELHNPVNHVDKWQSPMLVIHGALDFRVPETQGIAAFTALQRRGIDSRFLYFPDENHWVLNSANSVAWHRAVLDWLATYLAR
jgi:dipeptidyl aminopeptidase/acylaminoacyl peptidase